MLNKIVEVKHLSHKYSVDWAIRDINFEIKENGVFGLLGSNGAGKSTTMNIICNVLTQTEGDVFINGINLREHPIEAKKFIGFLPQKAPLHTEMTVDEYLYHCADIRLMPKKEIPKAMERAKEKCGITHFSKRQIRNLSGGYQQRVGIAQAIIHNPLFVILDEPTNGLDPIGISEIRTFIRRLCDEGGKTVLLSSHILSEISLMADDIGIIDHGVLLEEESLSALESKNGRFIHLGISDAAQAARLLETVLHTGQFRIDDDKSIRIFDTSLSLSLLSETMVKGGVALYDLHLCENTLEDYFKRVTGGEGIA